MMADGKGYMAEADMIDLMLRVRRALDQELQCSTPEEEVVAQIRRHLQVVEKALPPPIVEAVHETYGLTRL